MAALAQAATMAFKPTADFLGAQPIHETSTTQMHRLGTRIRGFDSNYGEAVFVYAAGVASTAVGDVCAIDEFNGTTTRAVTGTVGTLGVACSANVASQYGWYLIAGTALVNAATSMAGSPSKVYLVSGSGSPGKVDSTKTTHNMVFGAVSVLLEGTSSGAGTGKVVLSLAYPYTGDVSISTI